MTEKSMKTLKFLASGLVVEVFPDGSMKPIVPQTNRQQVNKMSEQEIEANAQSDPDNPPLLKEELDKFTIAPNIKQIRLKLNLSQQQFANKFHLSLKTLQDWEQGRTQPDQAAKTLLKVIANNPEAVIQALAQS